LCMKEAPVPARRSVNLFISSEIRCWWSLDNEWKIEINLWYKGNNVVSKIFSIKPAKK